uniref:RING-type E3 ubiquitin transferase n=2 Tax=Kalanchoe fedtschenkoi TaxID=63787 RepID=A0A7N0ZTP5_KALFE
MTDFYASIFASCVMKGSSKRKVIGCADDKKHGCSGRGANSGSSSKGAKGGKAGTSSRIKSEVGIAENIPQQPPELVPACTDSGRKYIRVRKRLARPDNALGLPAPKFSVTACHECRQTERAHKWCLRSLNCGSPMEAIVSGSSSAASADVKVPKPVSGISGKGRGYSSAAKNDASVAPKSSRKSVVSKSTKSAKSANLNKLLSPRTVTAPSPSLASGVAAGPQSQNKQFSGSAANAPQQPQVYYDPFINLRLDIDNMSYEDLLALQEQIGYISTGLSEEELGKCRKIHVYGVKHRKTTKQKDADAKCSVCQEEFRSGDKMGSLKCKHSYHVTCIDEWLRQKNWCPTCKAGAVAPA